MAEKPSKTFNRASGAYEHAAAGQAAVLGISDQNFINALVRVNEEKGTSWFMDPDQEETWQNLLDGHFLEAIASLFQSEWFQNAPDEVRNLQNAIKNYAEKLDQPEYARERALHENRTIRPAVAESETATYDRALSHLLDREGYRTEVYLDSEGHPTVGVGHLVRPGDNLKVGDEISPDRARELLEQDAQGAFSAAKDQMAELGITDPNMLVALTSVNFQLGTGWTQKFPNTWEMMKEGRFDQAADSVGKSLWAKQTPVRVADFQDALRTADTRPATMVASADKPEPQQEVAYAPQPSAPGGPGFG